MALAALAVLAALAADDGEDPLDGFSGRIDRVDAVVILSSLIFAPLVASLLIALVVWPTATKLRWPT